MPHDRILPVAFALAAFAAALSDAASAATQNSAARKKPMSTITERPYARTQDGKDVVEYTLSSPAGLTVKLLNYGALVASIQSPDKNGKPGEITLGFDDWAGWEKNGPYFGVTTGRYCNRIAKGTFTLDGKKYTLATNNGPNHLHGGVVGFNKRLWSCGAKEFGGDQANITFLYTSPDGEEGYPGTLHASVTYSLSGNELSIEYHARTDKPTHVNLTNHTYFNLAGRGTSAVLDHEITIRADRYLPVDDTLIPTGELAEVKGTPMDLTRPTKIGAKIKDVAGGGYDHCYVLAKSAPGKLELAAVVRDPASGRVMEILTTEPGIQFYTGNFLDGGADSAGNKKHFGFCLETQHFPDSPNQPAFPPTVLRPGERYQSKTVHRFSVRK
jgi:aldose 1-epimerase